MIQIRNPPFEENLFTIRAIAILAVVLFHLGLLKNGYFGVDCFFVLSGFLISYTFKEKKSFDYVFQFYQKRLSRIVIPTLSCIFITLIISLFILNSFQYEKILQVSKSFTLFYFNFGEFNNYFSDNFNSEKLLVHLWSICVEIQFYLLFPIIIIFPNRFRIFCLYSFILLSLIFIVFGGNLSLIPPFYDSDFGFNKTPGFINHYHILGRLWEFCTGILLSLTINQISLSKRYYIYLFTLSLIILFSSLSIPTLGNSHPNFFNILPVISTLGLIICAKKIKFFFPYIFVPIGKRAFSIYLVHQPIIFGYLFFIGYLSEINYFDYALLGILIYIVTIFYFKFIEVPSLNMKQYPYPKIIIGFLLALCVFSYLIISSLIQTNYIQKFWIKSLDSNEKKIWKVIDDSIQAGLDKKFKVNNCNIISKKLSEIINNYKLCHTNTEKSILIIGDSHATDLFYALDKNYNNYQLSALVIPGCRFNKKSLNSKDCSEFIKLPNFLKENEQPFSKILFKVSGNYISTNPSLFKSTEIYFQNLSKINVNSFWIGANLEPVFTPRVFNPKIHNLNLLSTYDKDIFFKIQKMDNKASQKYKDKYISLIKKIHLSNMPNIVNTNNLPFYSDTDHWNFRGEKYYGKLIGSLLLLDK